MSSSGFDMWIKAGHVAAVLAFVGGLLATELAFALPALQGNSAPAVAQQLSRWNRRLTAPALVLTWAFGLTLALSGGWLHQRWLVAKLAVVLLLSAWHGVRSRGLRRIGDGDGDGDGAVAPAAHGTLLVVSGAAVIVVLVVVKPF